ncbi:Exported zinc metalloprotease YfgC precursor [hydrothermal vent metagenome]|uniref:Exported zinc metalloprotease YfgC n=1 Tax=hydrothermal vent metagenome TaxID=652676 RepID=A0A3B0YBI7_9ZZZZ
MIQRTLQILVLTFLSGGFLPFAHGEISANQLPDFGDSSGALISPVQEQALGEAFMRSVRSQATLVTDPNINSYIRQLGARLVANSDTPNYPFTFFVVDDPSINAFAGPGGRIGVHTGLLLAAENESELAGVMAHEIAHVTQRHLLRAYESAQQLSLPTAAATIAAILLGVATGSSNAGIAAASAVQAGSIQQQLNFTRANEKEADRIGIQTLARSGIDPFGMPAFFERLYQTTRLYGTASIPEFLSTHPVTTDRIAESTDRAGKYGHTKRRDTLEFELAKVRLAVQQSRNPGSLLRSINADAGPAQRYGLALIYWRIGDKTRALKQIAILRSSDPDRILYRTTQARLLLEDGKTRKALRLFEDAQRLYPGDVVVGQYYAEALLIANKPAKARNVILALLRDEHARTPPIYKLWARATSKNGPAWETRFASAELYSLGGNLPLAIDQLEQALRLKGLNDYDRARIQAKLHDFKSLLAKHAERE